MHSVRQAVPSDAAAIGELVRSLAGESLIDPKSEEAERFYESLAVEELARSIALPNRFYVVAEVDRTIHGMIMVRDANYVGQFFVRAEHQHKGVGSALWRFVLTNSVALGASGEFTVRSSLAAESVYRHLGFVPTGSVETHQGFRFIPMRRERKSAA